MIFEYAFFSEFIGVAFSFECVSIQTIWSNSAGNEEIVDDSLMIELKGFFDSLSCATDDDSNIGASVMVGELLLRFKKDHFSQYVFEELWEPVNDATNEIKQTQ